MPEQTQPLEINTSLMAEKLKKSILHLQNTVKYCKDIEKYSADEIKNEKSPFKKAQLLLLQSDTALRCEIVDGLLQSRKKHYEKDFLPEHDRQLKECNKNFDALFKRTQEFVKNPKNEKTNLAFAYFEYMRLNPDHKDEEYKVALYQGMKKAYSVIDKNKPTMRIVK